VDDEAGVRQLAKTLCSQLGFTVIEAEDGHQALAAFQANPERFDLVLLDLTMPNLTGHDTFMSLRAIRADVRIILCSGYAETNTMSRLQGVRPAAFLSKPYSCDEFKNVVKKVMGTR
jgi:CheY-like chemotaxis protein